MPESGCAMREVYPHLFVGAQPACRPGTVGQPIVHACKSPCHQSAVGYTGSLPRDHPSYLAHADEHNLWLNLIDPHIPLFQPDSFTKFLAFAAPRFDALCLQSGHSLLVHCNQGGSRSPSLALLLLARHLRVIPDESYVAARAAYLQLDTAYQPGQGIARFLAEQWPALACPCPRCRS